MKEETKFRIGHIDPFLKKLKNCKDFSIQQMAIRGTPDKLICLYGRFVGMEIKRRGEKPDPLQAIELAAITKAGGIAMVVDPDNWGWARGKLRRLSEGDLDD